jgi:hypothetical protein
MPMTPWGYQAQSESNLAQAGWQTGNAANIGQNLYGAGAGILNNWSSAFGGGGAQLMRQAQFRPNLVQQAGVDANAAGQQALGMQQRQMERMGINPNSGRFAGLTKQWAEALAASVAGAKTRASRAEQDSVFNRLQSALGYGNQLLGAGMGGMERGGNMALNAGQGYRQQAADYGSLAAGSAQNQELGNELGKGDGQSQMSPDRQQIYAGDIGKYVNQQGQLTFQDQVDNSVSQFDIPVLRPG